jgi:hypothetical protein
MTRSKTRRSWAIVVPVLVLLVGVLVLGLQANSSPFSSDMPAPEGTARITADTATGVAGAASNTVPMDQWRYSSGPMPPPPPTVPGSSFSF